ncbi:hypothetical protein HNP93_000999 [Methanococcus maripaludis]|uniref:Uncharacterized protein n=1 Tax=Methanococcus maripaludis TaxID=39152 RepID=A0A7J9P6F2_METMI|nr:hypothetical protein [Methanococcus maripaludis]MBA2858298.1 hypothetical protein [Methanococcus maripaludis]
MLTDEDYKIINNTIQGALMPISTLIKEVPTRIVPDYADSVKTYIFDLKSNPKKTSKNADATQADMALTSESFDLEAFSTPNAVVSHSMIEQLKAKGLDIGKSIDLAFAYSLIAFENQKVISILDSTTGTGTIDLTTDTALHERLNSIQAVVNDMTNKKIPITNLKLVMNAGDMSRLNFNEYMKAGTAVLENDLKIKVIPCSEVTTGTAYLYESNPLIMDVAVAQLSKLYKVNPKTNPQDYDEFYLQDKFGGKIKYNDGVRKLTVTLA